MPSKMENGPLQVRCHFGRVNSDCMVVLPLLLLPWLPEGQRRKQDCVSPHRTRSARHPINPQTALSSQTALILTGLPYTQALYLATQRLQLQKLYGDEPVS
jgi:hypothetical protein